MSKEIRKGIPFWVCLITMIATGVASFLVPPMGVIDDSVLKFMCLLFGMGTLAQIPVIIKVAGYVKMTKGDMTIEAKGVNNKND